MVPRFQVGDRVKIRRTWSEENGAIGTVSQPPDSMRNDSGFGSNHFKQETSLTGSSSVVYWVELDVPEVYPGVLEGGEYDESELEKV